MRDVMRANLGLVLAGLISFVLMGAGQSLYGPALPAFARAFGLITSETGLLVSAHWVGAATGVAGMFFWGDRITPRLALAMMALGSAAIAVGPGWWLSLLAAAVFGLGYGASTVIYNRRFLILFGDRGPSMLALLNAIFGIGAIGAPLAFVATGSSIGLAYGVVALMAVAVFAVAGPAPAPLVQGTGPGRYVFRPLILGFGAVAIAVEACLIGLGPTALIAQGVSETRAGELLSAFFVVFLLVRLGLVGFSSVLPPFVLFTAALTVAAGAALGAVMISAPVFFVAMGGSAGLFFPTYYVTATAQMGDDARVGPTIVAAGMAGGIAAPVLLGAVMGQMGDQVFFVVLAVVLGLASLAALAMLARMRRG